MQTQSDHRKAVRGQSGFADMRSSKCSACKCSTDPECATCSARIGRTSHVCQSVVDAAYSPIEDVECPRDALQAQHVVPVSRDVDLEQHLRQECVLYDCAATFAATFASAAEPSLPCRLCHQRAHGRTSSPPSAVASAVASSGARCSSLRCISFSVVCGRAHLR